MPVLLGHFSCRQTEKIQMSPKRSQSSGKSMTRGTGLPIRSNPVDGQQPLRTSAIFWAGARCLNPKSCHLQPWKRRKAGWITSQHLQHLQPASYQHLQHPQPASPASPASSATGAPYYFNPIQFMASSFVVHLMRKTLLENAAAPGRQDSPINSPSTWAVLEMNWKKQKVIRPLEVFCSGKAIGSPQSQTGPSGHAGHHVPKSCTHQPNKGTAKMCGFV